jgi:hypothetical protein
MIGLFSKILSPSHKVRSVNASQKCKGFVNMLNVHWVSYEHEGEWCNAQHNAVVKQS